MDKGYYIGSEKSLLFYFLGILTWGVAMSWLIIIIFWLIVYLFIKQPYNWYYDTYLKSEHWCRLRKRVLVRDHYQCTQCHSKRNLQVHHLVYHLYHEQMNELTTLCRRCHRYRHNKY
jgi:hypothetical protein